MVLLYRCKLGEGMNRFRNWQVLEEKVTGNGITRVMINEKSEIAKFHFMSGKDIDGVYPPVQQPEYWELVFFCGRVDNQMVLF